MVYPIEAAVCPKERPASHFLRALQASRAIIIQKMIASSRPAQLINFRVAAALNLRAAVRAPDAILGRTPDALLSRDH
jgi:hypothetical protein